MPKTAEKKTRRLPLEFWLVVGLPLAAVIFGVGLVVVAERDGFRAIPETVPITHIQGHLYPERH
ncbi:MAG: hypothetical protein KGJ55_09200 [Gammaproteobacteria bacterium]|nr:hypothetical protein [Gammaproteobacteria bacterium]